jgi:uncharacterized protein with von Willebrand factor type A (vWA) domain
VAENLDGTAAVVALGRLLRVAGVAATTDRVAGAVRALASLDPARRADVYWAGRITLCTAPADIARYDAVFGAVFDRERVAQEPHVVAAEVATASAPVADETAVGESNDGDARIAAASAREVLRHRDVSALDAADRAVVARLLARLSTSAVPRRIRRTRPARTGTPDPVRTMRALVRDGGEIHRLARRERVERPRRIVLLVDVSGSMAPYADALLRFAHAAARRGGGPTTEVFTLGTRLTRVTREMRVPDPDAALTDTAAVVADWSGGTRLGVLLKEFLDDWGQRGIARGAVVVVMSDGWERGDVTLLGAQMERLHRLAHRVIWANPRAGRPGFEPLAAGVAAALPHVDDLVAGHSVAALEHLADVVAGAGIRSRRHA